MMTITQGPGSRPAAAPGSRPAAATRVAAGITLPTLRDNTGAENIKFDLVTSGMTNAQRSQILAANNDALESFFNNVVALLKGRTMLVSPAPTGATYENLMRAIDQVCLDINELKTFISAVKTVPGAEWL